MLKLGCLAPEGTFSYLAAVQWSRGQYELVTFASITEVLEAFVDGKIDRAIVPIENALGDVVHDAIDFLMTQSWSQPRLRITEELLLPITQTLWGRPETSLAQVAKVISHPQGLAQCRVFLSTVGKAWEQKGENSTASAISLVASGNDPTVVAIGPPWAGEKYGLQALHQNVSDSEENVTRFIVLGGPKVKSLDQSKTTIFFETKDEPGALYQCLGVFYYQDLNLARIDSYTAKQMGRCYFWIDVDGDENDPALVIALQQLKDRFTQKIVVVGSYPKAQLTKGN